LPPLFEKERGISMNFFGIFPLSNSVREGELKGVSQKKNSIVQNKCLKE